MRHGLAGGATEVANTSGQKLVTLARAINNEDAWRTYCLKDRGHFPAGVTYLSQFMAHDLTHTASVKTAFHPSSGKRLNDRFVNLRTNQLMLDTLYGDGPDMDPLLFNGDQFGIGKVGSKFNLEKLAHNNLNLVRTVPLFSLNVPSNPNYVRCHPQLGDMRNSDHPIIMRIATMLMMYHNYQVGKAAGPNDNQKYLEARIKTTLAWHKIIRKDIIENVCLVRGNSQFDKELDRALDKQPDQVETDFLHGLLRSFHSLTLPNYELAGGKKSISSLLDIRATCPSAKISSYDYPYKENFELWQNVWDIEIAKFFRRDAVVQTAFSPSYAFHFGNDPTDDNSLVLIRDQQTSAKLGVSEIGSPLFDHLIDDSHRLLSNVSKVLGIARHKLPRSDDVPLHLTFLAEAQTQVSDTGTLGKTGSVFFYRMIDRKIKEAQIYLEHHKDRQTIDAWYKNAPEDFYALSRLVAPKEVPKHVQATIA